MKLAGFDVDGGSPSAIPGLERNDPTSFYGVEVHGGDLDGDGDGDILATHGPGPLLDSRLQGYRYVPSTLQSIAGVDFMPYDTTRGAHVATASVGL